MYLCMILSKSLPTTLSREIGRLLEAIFASPFLKMGITRACSHFAGKVQLDKDKLNKNKTNHPIKESKINKGLHTDRAVFLSMWWLISSSPDVLFVFRVFYDINDIRFMNVNKFNGIMGTRGTRGGGGVSSSASSVVEISTK